MGRKKKSERDPDQKWTINVQTFISAINAEQMMAQAVAIARERTQRSWITPDFIGRFALLLKSAVDGYEDNPIPINLIIDLLDSPNAQISVDQLVSLILELKGSSLSQNNINKLRQIIDQLDEEEPEIS